MQYDPLLRTKLYIPPVRPELVPRPRLIARLNEGLERKLTLLSAPAGSGKTTLLSEWVSQLQPRAAWLSLDPEDDDMVRFWIYLLAALQNLDGDLGQETRQILQVPQPPAIPTFLTPLLNALAAHPEMIVLVLDDYHLISNQTIHDGISFFLEHQPSQFHLVVATRADPPLPIGRLRARGQLAEFRVGDLRFTPEEATAFLNDRMELGLQSEDVMALESRTEGWIVGLKLAALSMRDQRDARAFISAFTGSHHFILEYLAEEVLQRQTEAVNLFMVQTSTVDRLCGPLCDAITGQDNGATMLAHLHRENLFVTPLDNEHYWYRYHPLFADLLQKRLRQMLPEDQVLELYRRASAWHEDNGSLDEVVKYALRAQDFERVVRLVEQAALAGALESRLTTMLRWLEAVPEELLTLRPRLRIYQAWALVINEQLGRAQQVLRECSETLQAMPPFPGNEAVHDDLATLMAIVDMMASALASAYGGEDLEKVFQAALEARTKALAAGNVFLASHAANGLAMARFFQGRLSEAGKYYWQLADLATQGEASQLPLAAVGRIGLAAVCLERNDLQGAELHLNEGMRLGQYRVGTNTLVSAAIVKSRLMQSSGDIEKAFEALDEAERIRHVRDSAPAMHRLTRQRAWLGLSLGDLDGATHLVQSLDNVFSRAKSGGAQPASFYEAKQILWARVHLLRDEAAAALDVLDPIHEDAKAAGRLGRVIEICLLKALAWLALGNKTAVRQFLLESLALAEPEGYVRVYLDEGVRLLPLLSALARDPLPPRRLQDYARELSSALGVDAGNRQPATDDSSPVLIEPLTERELQVLRLMAAGLSSPEIAEELVVAVSTARSHIKSIYGKLDAHSRYEALDRATQLQLL